MEKDDMAGQPVDAAVWREAVLPFEAARSYEDPLRGCPVAAAFVGPSGKRVCREGYWDGGRRYCVSFAAPEAGRWHWTLSAPEDSGLDGRMGILDAHPYEGSLPIFRHGFIRVARPDEGFARKLLAYADGTPFFWLGDTHWEFASGESWARSNHSAMESQFRGMVDRRVKQGFTVYQTNLRSDFGDRSRFWLTDADDPCPVPNPAFFRDELDRRMRFIADAGLVNAMGFAWGPSLGAAHATSVEEQMTLARYCVARYGALPVIWSIAGEVAGYDRSERDALIGAWRKVAQATSEADGGLHPCTVHYTNERPFADYYCDEPWFDFTLNQAGHGDYVISESDYRSYLDVHAEKPFVEGEAFYEGCSSLEENGTRRIDAAMLRRVAYVAFQSGASGYTYGAQGIWDNVWNADEQRSTPLGAMMADIFNRYGVTWAEAIDAPGADQMGIRRRFYEEHAWWDLAPCTQEGSAVLGRKCPLASVSLDGWRMVAYYPASARKQLQVQLKPGRWHLEWFDPRDGSLAEAGTAEIAEQPFTLPAKPTLDDWLLVLERADAGREDNVEQDMDEEA